MEVAIYKDRYLKRKEKQKSGLQKTLQHYILIKNIIFD